MRWHLMRASSRTVLYCQWIWPDASDMWTCFGMSWPWPPLGSFQTRDSSVSQCIGCGFFFQHRKDSCLHCSAVRVPALALTIMNLFILGFWPHIPLPQADSETPNPQLSISSLLSSFTRSHGRFRMVPLTKCKSSPDQSLRVYACGSKIVQA